MNDSGNGNISSNVSKGVGDVDPVGLLVQILKIAPRLSMEEIEEECLQNDILQFLKIISYEFTSHVLSEEELQTIRFREPHLLTPLSLYSSDLLLTAANVLFESGAYASLLHFPAPKFCCQSFQILFFFF
ncbi:hypothetical protein RFI_12802 [Reticulomyxa filosa]|uniref:Uncharacterized protein n=1 Tax=Reticulomyxa filosa TaxID=46433 RepID=X6NDE2_RETFI|nr:hypothetical protein RFI_12802 [Reticulomyxa filosa]|eukprot:ETO24350.1 hypothetical protein RFI_12802 [Reticulomyxa filosa]